MRLRRAVPPCPFWQQVGNAAFGGWDKVRGRPYRRPPRAGGPEPVHPVAGGPALSGLGCAGTSTEYTAYYARVYPAIAEVSGCDLIVDSSKHPSLAIACAGGPTSTCASCTWSGTAVRWPTRGQAGGRPDTDAESYMTTYSPGRGRGAVEHAERRLPPAGPAGRPVLRIRYEDFAAEPETACTGGRLRRAASETATWRSSAPTASRAGRWKAHSASGNPMRFSSGQVPIRRDERWRTAMPRRSGAP